jgi:Fe2+ transport system protein B
VDATAMERNLNLALQVMEMTENVVICVNLMDEAKKKGIVINEKKLAESLGVPVVPISARNKKGITNLLDAIEQVVRGQVKLNPYQVQYTKEIEESLRELEPQVASIVGNQFPLRWIALRVLDGDTSFLETIQQHQQKDMSHIERRNSAYGKSVNS